MQINLLVDPEGAWRSGDELAHLPPADTDTFARRMQPHAPGMRHESMLVRGLYVTICVVLPVAVVRLSYKVLMHSASTGAWHGHPACTNRQHDALIAHVTQQTSAKSVMYATGHLDNAPCVLTCLQQTLTHRLYPQL